MGGIRRPAVLAIGPLLVASQLTCSEFVECGSSSVRFVLPEPGDELALRVRLCIEPSDLAGWSLGAGFDELRMPSTTLVLEVEDGEEAWVESTAEELAFGEAYVSGWFDPRHCDEGLAVVVRREDEGEAGPLHGWMYAYFEDEGVPVCTTRWERSDAP